MIPLVFLVVSAHADTTPGYAAPCSDATLPVIGKSTALPPTPAPSDFTLPTGAVVANGVLAVEIPAEAPEDGRCLHCEAPLDLTGLVAAGRGIALSVRVRGEGVSNPDARWNGVKVMIRYVDGTTGATNWPRATLPTGTFDWRTAIVRISDLLLPRVPDVVRATLVLGLEGCTGRAEFDLSTIRLEQEMVPTALVNEDFTVRYPADDCQQLPFENNQPRRGCMLPQRPTTEDDIETLRQWGATLVRFQICRNFLKGVDDNQDLPEYAAWVDSRLDNLDDVLRWCGERGMKVCIDLHVVPGGRRAGDREMNMFHDSTWADAFVETWRRIAARFSGHPAIYGFDLVNEPYQHGPAPITYWEIQRRAAEAVRAIDPETPIVVESNMAASYHAFRYLSPFAMDNVIYQFHMYAPNPYTHQGIAGWPASDGRVPLVWPGIYRGETWDRDYLRRTLAYVRDFQLRHRARIYVGEFSVASWAPGADQYLRDCIDLFEEYGWDWTYHAFRESPVWDVEKERGANGKYVPSPDNPRKRALLDGFIGNSIR